MAIQNKIIIDDRPDKKKVVGRIVKGTRGIEGAVIVLTSSSDPSVAYVAVSDEMGRYELLLPNASVDTYTTSIDLPDVRSGSTDIRTIDVVSTITPSSIATGGAATVVHQNVIVTSLSPPQISHATMQSGDWSKDQTPSFTLTSYDGSCGGKYIMDQTLRTKEYIRDNGTSWSSGDTITVPALTSEGWWWLQVVTTSATGDAVHKYIAKFKYGYDATAPPAVPTIDSAIAGKKKVTLKVTVTADATHPVTRVQIQDTTNSDTYGWITVENGQQTIDWEPHDGGENAAYDIRIRAADGVGARSDNEDDWNVTSWSSTTTVYTLPEEPEIEEIEVSADGSGANFTQVAYLRAKQLSNDSSGSSQYEWEVRKFSDGTFVKSATSNSREVTISGLPGIDTSLPKPVPTLFVFKLRYKGQGGDFTEWTEKAPGDILDWEPPAAPEPPDKPLVLIEGEPVPPVEPVIITPEPPAKPKEPGPPVLVGTDTTEEWIDLRTPGNRKRMAIAISDVSAERIVYADKGRYISREWKADYFISKLYLSVNELVPDGCSIDYYVSVGNSQWYPITPVERKIDGKAPRFYNVNSPLTKSMREKVNADMEGFIDIESDTHIARVRIDLSRKAGDESAARPIVYGYVLKGITKKEEHYDASQLLPPEGDI